MNNRLEKIVGGIESLTDNTARLISLLTIPLILCLMIEVFFRYALNSPTIWANDVSQYIFGFIFLLGGAYTLGKNGHVRVDIIYHIVSKRSGHILTLISFIPIYAYLAVFFYIGGKRFLEAITIQERFNLSVWEPLLWPVLICLPLGALLMLLRLFAMTCREVEGINTGEQQ